MMPRELKCHGAARGLGQCEIVGTLMRRLDEQKAFSLRLAERIGLASEVLGNLAEKRTMAAPQQIPDVRQRDDHSCATACLQAIAKYHYGRSRAVLDLSHPIRGTDPATLEGAIRANLGWNVIAGNAFTDDLQRFADTHRPAICLVTWPGAEDSHYVVCSGVFRGRIHYHDPLTGPDSLLASEFESAWRGLGQYGMFKRWALAAWPC